MEPSNSYLCAMFALGMSALAILLLLVGMAAKSRALTQRGWILVLVATVLWVGSALFKLGIVGGR